MDPYTAMIVARTQLGLIGEVDVELFDATDLTRNASPIVDHLKMFDPATLVRLLDRGHRTEAVATAVVQHDQRDEIALATRRPRLLVSDVDEFSPRAQAHIIKATLADSQARPADILSAACQLPNAEDAYRHLSQIELEDGFNTLLLGADRHEHLAQACVRWLAAGESEPVTKIVSLASDPRLLVETMTTNAYQADENGTGAATLALLPLDVLLDCIDRRQAEGNVEQAVVELLARGVRATLGPGQQIRLGAARRLDLAAELIVALESGQLADPHERIEMKGALIAAAIRRADISRDGQPLEVAVGPWTVGQLAADTNFASRLVTDSSGWVFTETAFAAIAKLSADESDSARALQIAAACAGSPYSDDAQRRSAVTGLLNAQWFGDSDNEQLTACMDNLQVDDQDVCTALNADGSHLTRVRASRVVLAVNRDPDRFAATLETLVSAAQSQQDLNWMVELADVAVGAFNSSQLDQLTGIVGSLELGQRDRLIPWLLSNVAGPDDSKLLDALLEHAGAGEMGNWLQSATGQAIDDDLLAQAFDRATGKAEGALLGGLTRVLLTALFEQPGSPIGEAACRLGDRVALEMSIPELQFVMHDRCIMWLVSRQIPPGADSQIWLTVCALFNGFSGTPAELVSAATSLTER